MSKQVNAFRCDWCTRCFGRKCDVNRHEEACNKNPARRHCKTCVHGVMNFVFGPYCNYHKTEMQYKPYFIDCETRTNYGFEDNPREMPGTCLYYEYKGKAEWTLCTGED